MESISSFELLKLGELNVHFCEGDITEPISFLGGERLPVSVTLVPANPAFMTDINSNVIASTVAEATKGNFEATAKTGLVIRDPIKNLNCRLFEPGGVKVTKSPDDRPWTGYIGQLVSVNFVEVEGQNGVTVNTDETTIEAAVRNGLNNLNKMIVGNKLHIDTVVLPILGSGNLRINPDISIKAIGKGIHGYASSQDESRELKNIVVVSYNRDSHNMALLSETLKASLTNADQGLPFLS